MKLFIKRKVLDTILTRCVEGYPYETAGLMLGYGGSRKAVDSLPTANVHEGDRRVRYRIDPMEYYRAEKTAEERGLQVVGVYHSHPDVAARPSAYDLEYAMPGWSYLIVSVTKSRVLEYTSWYVLERNGQKEYVEEDLTIIDGE
ncbi:MAG: M67 family metallopeptidase [Candidatus Caldarchaeum sp.]|uniref:M67 family peptidase n=1 Tax=Caldiarchaeum subterraneum TaxID=311458 RepID=A0A7C5LBW9_CALS0